MSELQEAVRQESVTETAQRVLAKVRVVRRLLSEGKPVEDDSVSCDTSVVCGDEPQANAEDMLASLAITIELTEKEIAEIGERIWALYDRLG